MTKGPIVRNLTGGLNCRESVTDLADNEAAAASNVDFYTAGAVARRGGWQKLIANSPTSNALLGIFQAVFNVTGTLTPCLVVTDGVGIWYTTNPAAANVSWTSIIGGATLDNSQPYHFVMMTNYLVIYNGVVAFYWAGPTNNLTAFALPSGTYYTLIVGDLTLTAVSSGVSTVTFQYTGGATAGAEVVSVSVHAISVQIQNGVSTAAQIMTAILAKASAVALVGTVVSGVASNPQSVTLASAATPMVAPYLTVPLSRAAIVWQNFLFWGGTATNPARLYFSALGDPTTYPQANFIDVPDPFNGDQITGLAILYGNLLIFKRYSFYILQGAPPGNLILSKLNSSVGCVEPASVVQIDNLVYFVSDKGLYAANLFNVQQKCYKVEPRYIAAVPVSSASQPIWGAHYKAKSQIFMSVNCRPLYAPSNGYNDRIMVHDYFNADQNGDPAVSEFIVGHTAYDLTAAKPKTPTAPSLMGDYYYYGTSPKAPTVMSSFYDPYVYVFVDGALNLGGPPDNISWLATPVYPPADFMSKFFDFGDPDMIKQMRWLWTTGQIYNNIPLAAGIAYNNSPTTTTFVNSSFAIELASPSYVWLLNVDDDGAFDVVKTTDTAFLTTLTLADSNGQAWSLTVDDNGAINTAKSSSTPNTPPVVASPLGYQFEIGVDVDGAAETVGVFQPGVTDIIPGVRSFVKSFILGGVASLQGKYLQVYFTGIGVLSQYSMDLIMKGRRS